MEKNKETMKAVLVDIDGTLVSLTDFDYSMVQGAMSTQMMEYLRFWNKETMKSTVLTAGVEMLKRFKEEGYKLVFLTSRGVECKPYTMRKLKEIGVADMVDSIWHRPVRMTGLSSAEYKAIMIANLIKKGYVFEWAMDDEDKNLVVMENMGMKTIDAKVWW
mgnify:CR=1 FL=1